MIAMDRSDVVDFPLKGPLLGKNMFFQFNQLKQDLTKEVSLYFKHNNMLVLF